MSVEIKKIKKPTKENRSLSINTNPKFLSKNATIKIPDTKHKKKANNKQTLSVKNKTNKQSIINHISNTNIKQNLFPKAKVNKIIPKNIKFKRMECDIDYYGLENENKYIKKGLREGRYNFQIKSCLLAGINRFNTSTSSEKKSLNYSSRNSSSDSSSKVDRNILTGEPKVLKVNKKDKKNQNKTDISTSSDNSQNKIEFEYKEEKIYNDLFYLDNNLINKTPNKKLKNSVLKPSKINVKNYRKKLSEKLKIIDNDFFRNFNINIKYPKTVAILSH